VQDRHFRALFFLLLLGVAIFFALKFFATGEIRGKELPDVQRWRRFSIPPCPEKPAIL
jgi:hypothetical protein